MAMGHAKSVDEYLGGIASAEVRESLKDLRALIRSAAPEAEESISYGIPTYKFHGYVASIGAYQKHCSFFAGHTVANFENELKPYKILKGTVQFPHGKPLPAELIQKMVRHRLAENKADSEALTQ